MRNGARARILAAALTAAIASPAWAEDGDAPAWFRRKKDAEEGVRQDEERKASEKAVIGGEGGEKPPAGGPSFAEITRDDRPPPETHLLFKAAGLTESFDLGAGTLSQDDLNGFSFAPSFAMGWWWTPKIIASFGLSGLVQFKETYVFGMIALGPRVRLVLGERWMLGAQVGYGISQGLSRVPESHIPPPPEDQALDGRHGISATLQAGVFFWPRRDLGIGPSISYTRGTHAERAFSVVTIGISYQSGRPNYTGDVGR